MPSVMRHLLPVLSLLMARSAFAQEPQPQPPAAQVPRPVVTQDPFQPLPDAQLSLHGPKNVARFNVLGLLINSYSVEFEHAVAKGFSSVLSATYNGTYSFFNVAGSGFTLGGRFFLYGVAPNGFFFGPEAHLFLAHLHPEGAEAPASPRLGWALGGSTGYNWVINNAVVVTPVVGLVSESTTRFASASAGEPNSQRLVPYVRINMGFAF